MNIKKLEGSLKKIIFNPLIQLFFVIFLSSSFYSVLSHDYIRFFLTISSCLKELLVFVLPFLLFSFVAVALSSIPREGMFFVLALIGLILLSNFMNMLISGCVGFFLLSGTPSKEIHETSINLLPIFSLGLPEIASTMNALFVGIIVGFVNSFHPNKYVGYVIHFLHDCIFKFMKKFFVPLLPLFVGGFLLKLFAEGRMTGFVNENSSTCLLMCGFLFIYLFLWLCVAASFKKERAIDIFKNSLPAIVTAFSAMSSAAALPLSLNAAEKNTKDKVLSDAVMPLTLNFHMVGDIIIVPILAMIVMLAFNHPLPSVYNFVMFCVFFLLNKFAGAGVPGGTILVTVPVLREFFGFDDSMTAFIIAFYGVIDPVATAGNVAGNNFFVVIFQKLRKLVKKRI